MAAMRSKATFAEFRRRPIPDLGGRVVLFSANGLNEGRYYSLQLQAAAAVLITSSAIVETLSRNQMWAGSLVLH